MTGDQGGDAHSLKDSLLLHQPLNRRRFGAALGAAAIAPQRGAVARSTGTPAAATPEATAPAITFPDGFLWGTASAAHQVEGAIAADGRGLSIWDVFSHTPGKTVHGDTGDIAVEQYRRFEDDFDLMAALGFRAYRFSISWSRIQPNGAGSPNQRGLDHYQRLVDALLERGISPVVTLYHWDLPQALEEQGGWTARDTAARYAEYAALVYRAIGDRVPRFLCLNEPSSQAALGYGVGSIAPGVTGIEPALRAAHFQLLGQGLAIQAMRAEAHQMATIGTTLVLWPVKPATDSEPDSEAARLLDGALNRLFLDPIFTGSYPEDVLAAVSNRLDLSFIVADDLTTIATPLDFLGVNYYTTIVVRSALANPAGMEIITPVPPPLRITPTGFDPATGGVTATGWQVAPDGLTDVLLRVHNNYSRIPLLVTETGAAYDDYVDTNGEIHDTERIAFLDAYIRAAHVAIQQGVDLRGLIVWCFQDNFASSFGYSKRFGLVWTDFASQQRIPKRSAEWFGGLISRNGLPTVFSHGPS